MTGPLKAGQARLSFGLNQAAKVTFSVIVDPLPGPSEHSALIFRADSSHSLQECDCGLLLVGSLSREGFVCLFKPQSGASNQQQGTVAADLELKSSGLGRRLVACQDRDGPWEPVLCFPGNTKSETSEVPMWVGVLLTF